MAKKIYFTIISILLCYHVTKPEPTLETNFNHANELFQQEKYQEAEYFYKQVLTIQSNHAQSCLNCGITLEHQNKDEEALEYYQQAIKYSPTYAKAHYHLAKAYKKKNSIEHALSHYKKAIECNPSFIHAYLELAKLLYNQHMHDEAIACLYCGIQANPDDLHLYSSCAHTLITLGRVDEAIANYMKIIKHNQNNISALYNISYALKMKGVPDQAIDILQRIIAIDPDYDSAQFALGLAYLNNGDFDRGWQQHDRFLQQTKRYSPKLKQWIKKNRLTGKKILLRPEGGLGDTIQFVRYAQLLKQLGATTIVVAQKPLIPLLSLCDYIDILLPSNSQLPSFDAYSTIMTIPALFESNEETIPRATPYLSADSDLVEAWSQLLDNDTNFKIGICWQADVFNDSSRPLVAHRGIPLEQLYPLAQFKNVTLYSLQKKDGLEQLNNIPDYFHITCFDKFFDEIHGSFMDTAAVMLHMNLIISVDSAVAHLAGALGKPVWLLLPYATDWRWLAGRTDSPWYPTMRIFKQQEPFNWSDVMHNVIKEIKTVLKNHP